MRFFRAVYCILIIFLTFFTAENLQAQDNQSQPFEVSTISSNSPIVIAKKLEGPIAEYSALLNLILEYNDNKEGRTGRLGSINLPRLPVVDGDTELSWSNFSDTKALFMYLTDVIDHLNTLRQEKEEQYSGFRQSEFSNVLNAMEMILRIDARVDHANRDEDKKYFWDEITKHPDFIRLVNNFNDARDAEDDIKGFISSLFGSKISDEDFKNTLVFWKETLEHILEVSDSRPSDMQICKLVALRELQMQFFFESISVSVDQIKNHLKRNCMKNESGQGGQIIVEDINISNPIAVKIFELKKDYSTIRKLVFIIATLVDETETDLDKCILEEGWLKLELSNDCINQIKISLDDIANEVPLRKVINFFTGNLNLSSRDQYLALVRKVQISLKEKMMCGSVESIISCIKAGSVENAIIQQMGIDLDKLFSGEGEIANLYDQLKSLNRELVGNEIEDPLELYEDTKFLTIEEELEKSLLSELKCDLQQSIDDCAASSPYKQELNELGIDLNHILSGNEQALESIRQLTQNLDDLFKILTQRPKIIFAGNGKASIEVSISLLLPNEIDSDEMESIVFNFLFRNVYCEKYTASGSCENEKEILYSPGISARVIGPWNELKAIELQTLNTFPDSLNHVFKSLDENLAIEWHIEKNRLRNVIKTIFEKEQMSLGMKNIPNRIQFLINALSSTSNEFKDGTIMVSGTRFSLSIEEFSDADNGISCSFKILPVILKGVSQEVFNLNTCKNKLIEQFLDQLERTLPVSLKNVLSTNAEWEVHTTTEGLLFTSKNNLVNLPHIAISVNSDGEVKLKNKSEINKALLITFLKKVPYLTFQNIEFLGDEIAKAEIGVTNSKGEFENWGIIQRNGYLLEWILNSDEENPKTLTIPDIGVVEVTKVEVDNRNETLALLLKNITLSQGIAISEAFLQINSESNIIRFDISDSNITRISDQIKSMGILPAFAGDNISVLSADWDNTKNSLKTTLKIKKALFESEVFDLHLDNHLDLNLRNILSQVITSESRDLFSRIQNATSWPVSIGILRINKVNQDCDIAGQDCIFTMHENITGSECEVARLNVSLADGLAGRSLKSECLKNFITQYTQIESDAVGLDFSIELAESQDITPDDFLVINSTVKISKGQYESKIPFVITFNLKDGSINLDENFTAIVKRFGHQIIEQNLQDPLNNIAKLALSSCNDFINSFVNPFTVTLLDDKDNEKKCSELFGNLDLAEDIVTFGAKILLNSNEFIVIQNLIFQLSAGGINFDQAHVKSTQLIKRLNELVGDFPFTITQPVIKKDKITLNADIDIQAYYSLPSIKVPITIIIDKTGLRLSSHRPLESVAKKTLTEVIKQTVKSLYTDPINIELFGQSLILHPPDSLDNLEKIQFPIKGVIEFFGQEHDLKDDKLFLTLNMITNEVKLPDLSQIGINTILNDSIEPIRDLVEERMNKFQFIRVEGPILENCNLKDINLCRLRFRSVLDLSGLDSVSSFLGAVPLPDVTMDKDGNIDVSEITGFQIPIPWELYIWILSFTENKILVGIDPASLGMETIISVYRLNEIIKIIARVKFLLEGPKIQSEGRGTLLSFIPIGKTYSEISKEGLITEVDIGGMLKKVISMDGCLFAGDKQCKNTVITEICSKAEQNENYALICGKAHLFKLLQMNFIGKLGKDLTLSLDVDDDFLFFSNRINFNSGIKFSNPRLKVRQNAIKLSDHISAGSIALDLSLAGASFDAEALGLSVTLVVQNLDKMDSDTIIEMILRLLLPDLDIIALFKALLDGNITINPFSSFGSDGGGSQADGGEVEGGEGAVEGGSVIAGLTEQGLSSQDNNPVNQLVEQGKITGLGMYSSVTTSDDKNALKSIINGGLKEYEKQFGSIKNTSLSESVATKKESSESIQDQALQGSKRQFEFVDLGNCQLSFESRSSNKIAVFRVCDGEEHEMFEVEKDPGIFKEDSFQENIQPLFNLPDHYLFVTNDKNEIIHLPSLKKLHLITDLKVSENFFKREDFLKSRNTFKRHLLEHILYNLWKPCLSETECELVAQVSDFEHGIASLKISSNDQEHYFGIKISNTDPLQLPQINFSGTNNIKITDLLCFNDVDIISNLIDKSILKIAFVKLESESQLTLMKQQDPQSSEIIYSIITDCADDHPRVLLKLSQEQYQNIIKNTYPQYFLSDLLHLINKNKLANKDLSISNVSKNSYLFSFGDYSYYRFPTFGCASGNKLLRQSNSDIRELYNDNKLATIFSDSAPVNRIHNVCADKSVAAKSCVNIIAKNLITDEISINVADALGTKDEFRDVLCSANQQQVEIDNTLTQDIEGSMVLIRGGTFTQGSEVGNPNESPERKVTIDEFWVSKYETTIGEWKAFLVNTGNQILWNASDNYCFATFKELNIHNYKSFLEKENDSYNDYPITCVSWNNAKEYISWLNEKSDGENYRLLTESEWEYIARAGSQTEYYTGDNITKNDANFNSIGTVKVDEFVANDFGLYNMNGNVSEWVEDCYHNNYLDAPIDGSVWNSNCIDDKNKVVRGGHFLDDDFQIRSSSRESFDKNYQDITTGFRIARDIAAVENMVLSGSEVYNSSCAACHADGIAGAPRVGDIEGWADRISQGIETIYANAINGIQGPAGIMPARGGDASLSDNSVKAAVDYMLEQSQ